MIDPTTKTVDRIPKVIVYTEGGALETEPLEAEHLEAELEKRGVLLAIPSSV
jgi:hypothetical protein